MHTHWNLWSNRCLFLRFAKVLDTQKFIDNIKQLTNAIKSCFFTLQWLANSTCTAIISHLRRKKGREERNLSLPWEMYPLYILECLKLMDFDSKGIKWKFKIWSLNWSQIYRSLERCFRSQLAYNRAICNWVSKTNGFRL